MISPQHSRGDGYARRKCDNCWDGKSTRDADKGILPTLCTGCEMQKGPFASEQKQQELWERAKEIATRLPQELRPRYCARATGKERMDVRYDVKDGLGHDEKQAGQRRKRVPQAEERTATTRRTSRGTTGRKRRRKYSSSNSGKRGGKFL
jgi:hypothetical protein